MKCMSVCEHSKFPGPWGCQHMNLVALLHIPEAQNFNCSASLNDGSITVVARNKWLLWHLLNNVVFCLFASPNRAEQGQHSQKEACKKKGQEPITSPQGCPKMTGSAPKHLPLLKMSNFMYICVLSLLLPRAGYIDHK